ncbi:MAG: HipA N-terminal domain-containing protein [Bacteroidota bacterium]
MRQGRVLFNQDEAGIITEHDDGSYTFHYHDTWVMNPKKPAISLTLPKQTLEFKNRTLFSFFYNMLPEGTNKQSICLELKIDPNDHFGLLLASAQYDTIGAVTLETLQD